MKNLLMVLVAILMAVASVSAQVSEEWVVRYNGQGNGYDASNSIAVDVNGNVYVTGISVAINTDIATIKYNAYGFQQWLAYYNGPEYSYDVAKSLNVDDNGNVYVTGYSHGLSSAGDYLTIKYNSNGIHQWEVRYNGPGNVTDEAYSSVIDENGNVFVTGRSYGSGTNYDYATVKYDSNGVQQWVARYNGPGNYYDGAESIKVDINGNVYVTGYSLGNGTFNDYATIKYDSNGVQQWEARYNGPGNTDDGANSLAIDENGNVYVTGNSYGTLSGGDYLTIKYNSNGVQQWEARYNGPGNSSDMAKSLMTDENGNVYVTGNSWGNGTFGDYATIKYDSNGVQQWEARYNGPGNATDGANSLAIDGNGNVYVTGQSSGNGTFGDYATIKYDSNGVQQWEARYNGPGNSGDVANSLVIDGYGNVYVTGQSVGIGTDMDYVTIKYSQTNPVDVSITPHNPPIQIPSGGGSFQFDFQAINQSQINYTIDIWTDVTLLNGSTYPILTRENINLSAGDTLFRPNLTQYVPGSILPGTYIYNAHIRDHDTWEVLAEDSFPFEKLAGDNTPNHNFGWTLLGWDNDLKNNATLPQKMELSSVYPNPFNNQTTISFTLPEPANIELAIYSIDGKKLYNLLNQEMSAGSHQINFNGQDLASGIYLCQLKGEDLTQTKKLVLMK